MNKSLIVSSTQEGIEIALLENQKLVELNRDGNENEFSVGDIYIGKVKKIDANLNACFVDIGYEKDGFLHYLDFGPQFKSLNKYVNEVIEGDIEVPELDNFELQADIPKQGKINEVITRGQYVAVQIDKEPISTKGHRLQSDISIAGRYIVVVPFIDTINVSKKIKTSKERNRLRVLIQSIKPKNFGVIIRTAAEGVNAEELHKDMSGIIKKWNQAFTRLKAGKMPVRIVQEMDRTSSLIRDLLDDSFTSIVLDDETLYRETRDYVKTISPEMENIVKLHKQKTPLYEAYDIDKQIKKLFGNIVNLNRGAYLVIEHTEALHVIDVNSGSRPKTEQDREANITQVNTDAAEEIARQLRLRDMGGIIVIDFIDMRTASSKKIIFDKMVEAMSFDRAKHTVLPLSKFGLMQITRQRVRPEINIATAELCPACEGTGKVQSSALVVDEIEANLKHIFSFHNQKKITLHAHPFIHAYLTKGLISTQMKWWFKFGHKVNIVPEKNYHILQYQFLNSQDQIIKLD